MGVELETWLNDAKCVCVCSFTCYFLGFYDNQRHTDEVSAVAHAGHSEL